MITSSVMGESPKRIESISPESPRTQSIVWHTSMGGRASNDTKLSGRKPSSPPSGGHRHARSSSLHTRKHPGSHRFFCFSSGAHVPDASSRISPDSGMGSIPRMAAQAGRDTQAESISKPEPTPSRNRLRMLIPKPSSKPASKRQPTAARTARGPDLPPRGRRASLYIRALARPPQKADPPPREPPTRDEADGRHRGQRERVRTISVR